MLVNYDVQKINHILEDFHNATGINMDILKDDFSYVGDHSHWENCRYCKAIQSTEQGKRACICSDRELFKKSRESRKAEVHICHAGLVDVSVPIIYEDVIIGYIIFGQIKVDTDFEGIKEYLVKLGLDENEMGDYFSEISVFDENKIQSISNIANMLAKHILLENMLKPDFDEGVQKTINYINDNLDSELSIQSLSKNVNISKSVLVKKICIDILSNKKEITSIEEYDELKERFNLEHKLPNINETFNKESFSKVYLESIEIINYIKEKTNENYDVVKLPDISLYNNETEWTLTCDQELCISINERTRRYFQFKKNLSKAKESDFLYLYVFWQRRFFRQCFLRRKRRNRH